MGFVHFNCRTDIGHLERPHNERCILQFCERLTAWPEKKRGWLKPWVLHNCLRVIRRTCKENIAIGELPFISINFSTAPLTFADRHKPYLSGWNNLTPEAEQKLQICNWVPSTCSQVCAYSFFSVIWSKLSLKCLFLLWEITSLYFVTLLPPTWLLH